MSATDTSQPQQPPAPPPTAMTISRPTVVAILYLLNFMIGFSVLVGVVLAYVWRGEDATQEWERTHYTYLIRTFWIGTALLVAAMLVWAGLFFGIIAAEEAYGAQPSPIFFLSIAALFGVLLLGAVWFTARCIMSLAKVGSQTPMPKPETWLI